MKDVWVRRRGVAGVATAILVLSFTPGQALGQTDRVGQAGATFLDVPVGARALAVGGLRPESMGGATPLSLTFQNPGSLGLLESGGGWFNRQEWIGGIDHQAFVLGVRAGGWGGFALTYQDVDYGDLYATVRADNDQGFEELGTFSPTSRAVGLAGGRALSPRLSFGAQARWVSVHYGTATVGIDPVDPSLGFTEQENDLSVFVFDVGTTYDSGYRGLSLGVAVRNFSGEVQVQDRFFPLPLRFELNGTVDLAELTGLALGDDHDLRAGVDVGIPRDADVQTNVSVEYGWRGIVQARAGLPGGYDERGLSAGFGLRLPLSGFSPRVDYAYTDMGIFGGLNTLSLGLGFP